MELQIIQEKILQLREQRIMLDYDLAEIYGIETKRLKEAVRRNIERFAGDDFMFQLTKDEIVELSRTQFASLKKRRGYNIKYAPFTLRHLALGYVELNAKLEKFMLETNMQFHEIYQVLSELAGQKKIEDKPRNQVGYLAPQYRDR